MGRLFLLCWSVLALSANAEPRVLLEETFRVGLSKDWFWGLGTWSAQDGVLRGFESGPRRHGPVKMRKLPLKNALVEFDYKLEGKATFAGIIFNGSQERGHILHLIAATDKVRVMSHPGKGASQELLTVPASLKVDDWHHVRLELKNDRLTATVDAVTLAASHPCIAEQKLTFGLTGDSGGPEGEKAGALNFRALKIMAID